MDEAVDAAEVDEDAERRDRAHDAGHALAGLEAAEQLVALLAALLVEGDLLRQDEAVRLAVDLEDLEAEGAADERLELLGDLLRGVAWLLVARAAREVDDLADRHEAAHAEVDDEAALVVVDDAGLDDLAGVEALLHRAPLALEAGTSQRQDRVALRRLGLEDVDEHLVADLSSGRRLVAVARAAAVHQLAVADDALALATEVDEDLVRVDADDRALDHVAVLEALHLVVGVVEQLGHGHRLGRRSYRRGLVGGGGCRLGLGRRLGQRRQLPARARRRPQAAGSALAGPARRPRRLRQRARRQRPSARARSWLPRPRRLPAPGLAPRPGGRGLRLDRRPRPR